MRTIGHTGSVSIKTARIGAFLSGLLLVLLVAAPIAARADFPFTTNGDGTLNITGYTGSGGAVVIPTNINGLTVTTLGLEAFASNANITSITIPYTITNIAAFAFYDCTVLTAITVDTSNAFYSGVAGVLLDKNQDLLIQYPNGRPGASYTISNGVTALGQYSFALITTLTNVTIPNTVTTIGPGTFFECTGLKSVAIPNSVTSIGDYGFAYCASLASVTIGNSLGILAQYAFADCASLVSVTLPASVTGIAQGAFQNCISLTAINVDSANTVYSCLNGVLFDKSQATLLQYPTGLAGSYVIPNTVTSIGMDAFFECIGLTGVTIPNSVTSIGQYAFAYCSNLHHVTIPASVTSLADYAFLNCAVLNAVYFAGNPPSADATVFSGDNATAYYLPMPIMGWGATLGGLPTVLWNPAVQTPSPTFGVQTNAFGFTITGTANIVVVVEATTSLSNPVWSPVSTNTLTGGSSFFSDSAWTNFPARDYGFGFP